VAQSMKRIYLMTPPSTRVPPQVIKDISIQNINFILYIFPRGFHGDSRKNIGPVLFFHQQNVFFMLVIAT
jgi:hypothetical protein